MNGDKGLRYNRMVLVSKLGLVKRRGGMDGNVGMREGVGKNGVSYDDDGDERVLVA